MIVINTKLFCWHNPPTLFHSFLVENVLWTESPSFVLRASVCPPPTSENISPPTCVVVAIASILPLPLFVPFSFVVLFWNRSFMGKGSPPSTAMLRSRLGFRKVTFAPPASWGKVNHIPPVFIFGVNGITCWSLPTVRGSRGDRHHFA